MAFAEREVACKPCHWAIMQMKRGGPFESEGAGGEIQMEF